MLNLRTVCFKWLSLASMANCETDVHVCNILALICYKEGLWGLGRIIDNIDYVTGIGNADRKCNT